MPVLKIVPTPARKKRKIKSIIDYIAKDDATLMYADNDGLRYLKKENLESITEHQETIKQIYNKEDGKQYFHFIISFHEKETLDDDTLFEFSEKFLQDAYFQGYDIISAIHHDKDHKHIHYIANSVNTVTGLKMDNRLQDLYHLRDHVNEISKQYNLKIPEKGMTYEGEEREEPVIWNQKAYRAIERDGSDYNCMIVNVADNLNKCYWSSQSKEEFIAKMKENDIDVDWSETRKNITFKDNKAKTKKNKIRLSTLNKYLDTYDKLDKEIMENQFRANYVRKIKREQKEREERARKMQEEQEKIRQSIELQKRQAEENRRKQMMYKPLEQKPKEKPKKQPPKMPVEQFKEINNTNIPKHTQRPNIKAPGEPESIKGGSTSKENKNVVKEPEKPVKNEPVKEKPINKPEVKSEEKQKDDKSRILTREEMLERSRRIASVVEGYNDKDDYGFYI